MSYLRWGDSYWYVYECVTDNRLVCEPCDRDEQQLRLSAEDARALLKECSYPHAEDLKYAIEEWLADPDATPMTSQREDGRDEP